MDSKQPVTDNRIWIHIKIVHACLLTVTIGTICGFWTCLNELQNLRKDLNAEIAKRTIVEFAELNTKDLNKKSNDSNDHHVVYTYTDKDLDRNINDDPNDEEKLIRVKRRARRKAYYKEEPEDMVWLTSYSRIPVSI